ncbi:tRNA(Ile)-lysidine synthetase [Aeromicrobium marinum DSM 15272]|uniref:tRNA(Ile)-lysidine synthase n=1 Tax=Aeromicrobium marinum DSM 15272 TaxID=585531 RepID=E2SC57_9ACTN|nr:tRNA lysidine(34) synthetase TilS [Aeromicrobium marinum]EFQ83343.1 tRNA(Ile)-lysidine synthetase [Aeromicrobium marinum DSM 15272]
MGGSLHPAVAAGRRAVAATLHDVGPGSSVVLGVSGGADSLALAAVTAFVARREAWDVSAVVVDHDLQPGSSEVAARAAEQCRGLGLRAEVVGVEVGSAGGPEAAARTARHGALRSAALAAGAEVICLAHTLDDQAETVLLGLGRGSGARSLSGMAGVDGLVRRPLLGLRRRDTEQICAAHGLPWWDDPHNRDPAHRRVRVRHEALPVLENVLGGGVAEGLARTARQLADDADLLDRLTDEWVVGHPAPTVADLAGLPSALRSRVLLRAARSAGCPPGELAAVHVDALDRLVRLGRGGARVNLPGGVTCVRSVDRVTFVPTPVAG